MEKPRLLFLITKASLGGAQRYVRDLAEALRDRYDVAVAAGGGGPLLETLAEKGVRTHALPFLLWDIRPRADLRAFAEILRLLRRERPEILHANSAKAGGLGALAGRLAGVPKIVFTAHGWEFNAPRGPLEKFVMRLASWLTVLLAHRTIAVSEAVRRDVLGWPGIGRKIVVVKNGVSCPRLRERNAAREALLPGRGGGLWIGMLSELNPTKRVEDAVRAFARLAPRRPDAVLIALGEGREREKLETLVRELRLGERVFLLGSRPEAAELLAAFDILVHTSRSEALGYALLEAGCASLPVVATAVGGIPEVVEDRVSGLIVPRESPEKLAAALEELADDAELRKRLGAALRKRVLAEFSFERMVRGTVASYEL